MAAREPTPAEWRLAFYALASLVRGEFPAEHTLAYIVGTWGFAVPEYVEAVRVAEEFTATTGSGVG
jgi:hypothetical protein